MNNSTSYWKIAAYITAYEDKEALLKCINCIQQQSYPISKIFIIDNSLVPLIKTDSVEQDKINTNSLIIEHYPTNIGIASGLTRGIQWAIEKEYDFLWTFDQDSQPPSNILEDLVNTYNDLSSKPDNKIGIIAPLPVNEITKESIPGIVQNGLNFTQCHPDPTKHYYECDVVITSGSLVSIAASKNTPLPNIDFFIDAVDYDHCLKLRQQNYKVIVVSSLIFPHRLGLPEKIYSKILDKTIYVRNYSPMRRYYICRNHTYLETRLCNRDLLFTSVKWRLRVMLENLTEIFYEKNLRILKTWACLKGTLDGFTGRLGKTW